LSRAKARRRRGRDVDLNLTSGVFRLWFCDPQRGSEPSAQALAAQRRPELSPGCNPRNRSAKNPSSRAAAPFRRCAAKASTQRPHRNSVGPTIASVGALRSIARRVQGLPPVRLLTVTAPAVWELGAFLATRLARELAGHRQPSLAALRASVGAPSRARGRSRVRLRRVAAERA